jgi:hypothetical protein
MTDVSATTLLAGGFTFTFIPSAEASSGTKENTANATAMTQIILPTGPAPSIKLLTVVDHVSSLTINPFNTGRRLKGACLRLFAMRVVKDTHPQKRQPVTPLAMGSVAAF